jgi:hypothetical protein
MHNLNKIKQDTIKKIQDMIISQDDNLKTELPTYVYNLLELNLKNI